MSEMVERVAKELGSAVPAWGAMGPSSLREVARRVIEAMRDPTGEMQTALGHAYREGLHMREVWNAGVNEALK